MANIGNLGAADSRRIANQGEIKLPRPRPKQPAGTKTDAFASARRAAELKRMEEAQRSRDSANGRVRASESKQEPSKRMSLEELAEVLRKVNLTFDLFEIQATFTIDQKTGDVSVKIINQRTGEVIRKIPPYDVAKVAEALKNGDATVTDVKA